MIKDGEHKPSHSHSHHHHHTGELNGRNLVIATLLNLVITVAEVIGGLISNSLALISDAVHNLGDTIAVFLALVAHRYSKKPSNERKTFGYRRIQILTALLNAVILIVISLYLLYEAYLRILNPEPIKGLIMFLVATIGLLANLAAMFLLRKDSGKSLNIKAAYIHLLSDTLSSVAVILGGILIYFYDWFWIDPIITIVISVYILWETWKILRQTIDILMQASPKGIDLKALKAGVESILLVRNIHHVHIWNLDDMSIHFECHLELEENIDLKSAEKVRTAVAELLRTKYDIDHVTIQLEYEWCHDKNIIHLR